MSTCVGPTVTATAAEALPARRLVRLNTSNQLALNAVGRIPFAITGDNAAASGDKDATATLLGAGQTFRLEMVTTCSIGSLIYAAASGKGSTTEAGGPAVGVAREASSGSGAIVEVVACQAIANQPIVMTGVAGSGTVTFTHNQGAAVRVAGFQVVSVAGVIKSLVAATTTITVNSATALTVTNSGIAADDVVTAVLQPTA